MSAVLALVAGVAAGIVHALSGPDHLAAVAPLGARRARPSAWRIGATWGAGHALGVAVLGGLAVLVRDRLDPASLSAWGERAVGAVLIAIGIWGLTRAAGRWTRARAHHHPEGVHTHIHLHLPGRSGSGAHSHASLWIGLLHGVAGGTHLLGFLPALALPGRSAAVGYVLGFAAGTILGMAAFAALIGRLAAAAPSHRPAVARSFLAACSVIAIAVGVVWLLP